MSSLFARFSRWIAPRQKRPRPAALLRSLEQLEDRLTPTAPANVSILPAAAMPVEDSPGLAMGATSTSSDPLATTIREDDAGDLVVCFTRPGDAGPPATWTFFVEGSARYGIDYTVRGETTFTEFDGSITFAPGESRHDLIIDPIADHLLEPDEFIRLFNNGSMPVTQLTILDDDNDDFGLSLVGAAQVAEDDAGGVTFRFTRTQSDSPVTIPVWIAGAHAGSDYTVIGADPFTVSGGSTEPTGLLFVTVTFGVGETVHDITIVPIDDAVLELNELLTVTGPDDNPVTARIIDNDGALLAVAATSLGVFEEDAQPFAFSFTRSGETSEALTFTFTLGGTAAFGVDYTLTGAVAADGIATATFAPGAEEAIVTITPIDDGDYEQTETVVFTIVDGGDYDVVGPAGTGQIADQDRYPTTILEDDSGTLILRFFRDGDLSRSEVREFGVGGSATFGVDYTVSGHSSFSAAFGSITFAPGERFHDLIVDPIEDDVFEGDEDLLLFNSSMSVIADLTIEEDDVRLEAVAPGRANENGLGQLVFRFTRAHATSPLTVNLHVAGTARFGDDYTVSGAASFGLTTASFVFGVGETVHDLTIQRVDDSVPEYDESVNLSFESGSPAAQGVIFDDDPPLVTVSVSHASADEAHPGDILYTFTRLGNTDSDRTLTITIGGDAGADDVIITGATGTGSSRQVQLLGSNVTATVVVRPVDDDIQELDEDFSITLAPGTGYTVGSPDSATTTIVDDDNIPFSIAGQIVFDVNDGQVHPAGAHTIYLDLNNDGVFQASEPNVPNATSYQFTNLSAGVYTIRAVLGPLEVATRVATVTAGPVGVDHADLYVRSNAVDVLLPTVSNIYQSAAPTEGERAIEALYLGILDRPSDPAGKAGWVSLYNAGVRVSDIVLAFERSQEYAEKYVRTMYRQLLGRDADPAGLAGWSRTLTDGHSTTGLIVGIMASAEFAAKQASTAEFVDQAYANLLNRDADPGSRAIWVQALGQGLSREAFVRALLDSPEARDRLTRAAYVTYLHRIPSAEELAGWRPVNAANTSTMFIAVILTGSEFRTFVD